MARTDDGHITDDVDGQVLDRAETVHWSLDGRYYEFDTSPLHARSFRRALRDYARLSRPDVLYGPAVDSHDTTRNQAHIRQWAADHGYQIGARGPIPGEVLAAYRASRDSRPHRD